MRINTQRIFAILMTHRAAEFILVKLGNRARQQRMLRFALSLILGKAGHIQPGRPGGAQHQVNPFQRLVGSQQRIGQPGQRFRLLFIHRQNGNVLFEERLPPRRIIGDDVFGAQGQDHRYIVLFRICDGLHRRVRHRLARLAAYEIGGQHQRGSTGDYAFRNAFRAELIHMAGADRRQVDHHFNMRGVRIKRRNVLILLAASLEEDFPILHGNLLQRLQAIGGKAGTDNLDMLHPFLTEHFQRFVGIGRQPGLTTKARLERHHHPVMRQTQGGNQLTGGIATALRIGIPLLRVTLRDPMIGEQQ